MSNVNPQPGDWLELHNGWIVGPVVETFDADGVYVKIGEGTWQVGIDATPRGIKRVIPLAKGDSGPLQAIKQAIDSQEVPPLKTPDDDEERWFNRGYRIGWNEGRNTGSGIVYHVANYK